jgi:hypothetical protein
MLPQLTVEEEEVMRCSHYILQSNEKGTHKKCVLYLQLIITIRVRIFSSTDANKLLLHEKVTETV